LPVFPHMRIPPKHPRAPRVLVDRRSPVLATIISNPNLNTSPAAIRETATLLWATRPMVHYFHAYGGYSRVGQVVGYRAVTRGCHKGRVVLTIETALNKLVKRNGDEVELMKGPDTVRQLHHGCRR